MIQNTENSIRHVKTNGNQVIKVTLNFPAVSDQKAESEFVGRLKEIYLRKTGVDFIHSGDKSHD